MKHAIRTKHVDNIHKGMPELDSGGKVTSFFEFWPARIIYIPVVMQWISLALRYRSLSLPLISNPSIPLSGMVGESKCSVLDLIKGTSTHLIAPYITIDNDCRDTIEQRTELALTKLANASIALPVVAKPDMGCRGSGVRIVRNKDDLADYLMQFPHDGRLLLQEKIQHEAEAGIFYIRHPGSIKGSIFSITLKYAPYLIGDGQRTLRQLIEDDARASKISALYFQRHNQCLHQVIPANQAFRLVFSGSHCRGSIFRNGNRYVTAALENAFDRIADDMNDFHYGRFDVRFESIEKLMKGEGFKILEVNGASSEATHIWDRNSRLRDVYQALFFQYRTLFKIGNANRKRGHKTPRLWHLLKAYRLEKQLVNQYPETE